MNSAYHAQRASGFSLLELMIALLLSAIIIAGALRLFGTGRTAYASTETIASLEERAAFALTALEDDLRLAGFWGQHNNPALLSIPAGIYIHCGGMNVSAWALRLAHAVEVTDDTTDLPCPPYTQAVSGSDMLVVRHASRLSTEPEADRIQLHTNRRQAELFSTGSPPAIPDAQTFNLSVNAWYLDQNSSESGLPALRRYALTDNGLLQNQEIMPGVEDFQISLGVDRDGDERIDGFVDAISEPTTRIHAVRLWLLLRSARPEPGHFDAGPWHSIDADRPNALQPNDNYRRVSVERTVWLRNGPTA
jgi:type IV pilus assembly protein PilW